MALQAGDVQLPLAVSQTRPLPHGRHSAPPLPHSLSLWEPPRRHRPERVQQPVLQVKAPHVGKQKPLLQAVPGPQT
jgi:hypothetical protein